MLQIRLIGLVFAFAGYLLYRAFRRAHQRGYIGPSHRRVHRGARPKRFRVALAVELGCALVCFSAAYLCLTHSIAHGF